METIFISIASYRDRLLANTVKQAYQNATNPNNLVFGIFEQTELENSLDINQFAFNNQIRYQRIDPEKTYGVCWARRNIQEMYQNETYYFQIDAHMLFEPGWDQRLISTYKEIAHCHTKPIITAYPNDFNPLTFEKNTNNPDYISTVWNLEERNDRFPLIGFNPPVGGYYRSSHDIVHGYHVGACFLFTTGLFAREIPYDPNIFFGGEEPLLSIRAWTHGYNIFFIKNVPAFHCWDKQYGGVVHTDNIDAAKNNVERARVYIEEFVRGMIAAEYLPGTVRSFDDYMLFSGLDYHNKKFTYHGDRFFNTPYTETIVY